MTAALPGQRLLQLSGVIVDLVYEVEAVPSAGEEAVVKNFAMQPGGGFNAMAAARRLGMTVSYGGGIGDGPLGQLVQAALAREDIAVLRPPTSGQDQGCSTVLIDAAGERTLIARAGAEGRLEPEDLARVTSADGEVWLLSGYQMSYSGSRDTMARWITGLSPDARLVFDPSPALARIPPRALGTVLGQAWWISANAAEAAALTGEPDPSRAAIALRAKRSRDDGGVIVRAGARGCYLAHGRHEVRHLPGHPVPAVDTNGAGDTHVGSFIAALARWGEVERALAYANAAAALSTLRFGPATAPPADAVIAVLRHGRSADWC